MRAGSSIGFVVPFIMQGGVETFIFRLVHGLRDRDIKGEIIVTLQPGSWYEYAQKIGINCKFIKPRLSDSIGDHGIRISKLINERKYSAILLNNDIITQCAIQYINRDIGVFPIVHNDRKEIYNIALSNREAWDSIISISPKTDRVCRENVQPQRVRYIPHGVELCDIPAEDPRRVARFLMIYAGRIENKQKGVFLLPEIMAKCGELGFQCNLLIAGEGPDREALEAMFIAKGLQHLVSFIGSIRNDEIYRHLSAAHVLILPSYYEGLPIVPLEAMACGCVPILTRLDGITDVIVDDSVDGMLVEVNKVEGFARAIVELGLDKSKWVEMSGMARRKIESKYSAAKMTDNYVELFDKWQAGQRGNHGVSARIDSTCLSISDRIPFLWRMKHFVRKIRSRIR